MCSLEVFLWLKFPQPSERTNYPQATLYTKQQLSRESERGWSKRKQNKLLPKHNSAHLCEKSSCNRDIIHNKFLGSQILFCRRMLRKLTLQPGKLKKIRFSSTQLTSSSDMLQPQLMADSLWHHLLNTGVTLRLSCQTLTEVHEQADTGFVLPEFKTEKRKKLLLMKGNICIYCRISFTGLDHIYQIYQWCCSVFFSLCVDSSAVLHSLNSADSKMRSNII